MTCKVVVHAQRAQLVTTKTQMDALLATSKFRVAINALIVVVVSPAIRTVVCRAISMMCNKQAYLFGIYYLKK